MKNKIILMSMFLGLLNLNAEDLIDLGEPDMMGFDANRFQIGSQINIKTGKDFKEGKIILSLGKNKDFGMGGLKKKDFEFFSSYFLSNMDSVNSPKMIYYSWEDTNNNKHSKVCIKKKTDLPNLKGKSGCAIMKELGTSNVEEYREKNAYIILCKEVFSK